MLNEMLIK